MKIKKIIEYGLYGWLLVWFWQTRYFFSVVSLNGEFFEYGSLSLYLNYLILIFLLIAFFKFFFFNWRQKFSENKQLPFWIWLLAFFELTVFLSVFLACDHCISFYRYIMFLLALGLFWLLIQTDYANEKIIIFFWLGLLLPAVLGIGQFLGQESPAAKWLGLAYHSAKELGASVIEVAPVGQMSERWLRAYGSFDHPNVFGGVLATAILLILFYLIQKKYSQKKQAIRYLAFFVLPFFVASLFFSFSRTAWLACIASLLSMCFFVGSDKIIWKELIAPLVLLVCFSFVLFLPYGYLATSRFDFSNRLENKSIEERLTAWPIWKEVVTEKGWLGVGVGNYPLVLAEKNPGHPAWVYQPIHNCFLLILAEIGWAGFFAFVFLFVYFFYQAVQKKEPEAFSLLVLLVILMSLDHWLWSSLFGQLFLFFVLGLIVKNLKIYGKKIK